MLSPSRGVDLIAYDHLGRLVLLAEVKGRLGRSQHWATDLRRNMLAHGVLPQAPFFLIATPERMYFWKDQNDRADAPPSFTLDAAQALKPYVDRLNLPSQAVGGQALEMLVASWLSDLSRAPIADLKLDPATQWLAESGLLDALGAGRIELHPA